MHDQDPRSRRPARTLLNAMSRLSRRDFLRKTAALGAGAALGSPGLAYAADRLLTLPIDLAVARGPSPADNCRAAVEALGGFSAFVKPGSRVVIKPNPVGRGRPELAINTHPDLVEVVVSGCMKAGAREVLLVSHDEASLFAANGIGAAAERAGGAVKALTTADLYREIPIPRGVLLRTDMVSADVLDADVFINMPIAKHHAGSGVTLSMKNLMGITWDRLRFHRLDLHRCIAELNSAVRQDLIIMDANHVLLTNGPSGPGEVRVAQTVIAGVDPVAIDAYTAHAFWGDITPFHHIRIARELGVGEMDLAALAIKEIAA
ncbi:DUF362 domain-containing protein [Candidatus Fermentibacteria bacterium]|nr:DUF362 domain-containing protein [Candidatus Fermentibacteria bacterium]